MRFYSFVVALLTLPLFADAKPPAKRYIVTLKDGASTERLLDTVSERRTSVQNVQVWNDALNGFAADLSEDEVFTLRQSGDVIDIEEDGIVHALASVTQHNATWGTARLSSRTPLLSRDPTALNFRYTYDSSGGAGVDIYVLGPGVRLTHVEFEGRARSGAVFGGYAPTDGQGHGTHCAGTAAGRNVGVAKKANIVSVRVLSDSGSGSVSNVVSGINWIYTAATTSGRPAVVLIALGGGASSAVDNAVTALTNAGIHVVAAAGGSNTGTENTSPARVPSVITVGATAITDARSSFSNYGPGIDIFAPGQSVYSAWHTSDTAYQTLSGTSMAAAHVAGAIAYLIGLEGNVSPAAMEAKLKARANQGVLTGIPAVQDESRCSSSKLTFVFRAWLLLDSGIIETWSIQECVVFSIQVKRHC
ncbi:serine protease [Coprinopsis cinerea AmutBmut pab1-1]|nr:serine protease [Coprinopsis cinerea AmutBmut pab1-1]